MAEQRSRRSQNGSGRNSRSKMSGREVIERVRRELPQLLGHALRRDPRVLDAAIDLAVPPIGLLALVMLAGAAVTAAAVALHLAAAWSSSPWLLAMVALTGFVVIGLLSAGAPASTYLALLEVPRFLVWKVLTYARIAAGFESAIAWTVFSMRR